MKATSSSVRLLGLALAMGVLVVGSAAYADLGRGWLEVPDAPLPYLYEGIYVLQIAVPHIMYIVGASPAEVGDPAPATIPVWVKNPDLGNTMYTATRTELWGYAFTYTPPAISAGDAFDACGTAIVSYGNGPEGGYVAQAICWGPGWTCDISPAPAFLWFVNASWTGIPCLPTGVEDAPWSSIKKLYR